MENLLMSQIRYESMSAAELRQYFLKHRHDRAAFQAYLGCNGLPDSRVSTEICAGHAQSDR